ncbi:hypothetical protein RJ640_030882 [Escallonia rubra]|uniref:DUF4408 domain-containing protein n=1 Tax=Escallonia rubra TaxID=112253 RepID=A0AA88S131_9ASTE|nr:hypothetical protein RJ640_030882 [Escallonia rubra]
MDPIKVEKLQAMKSYKKAQFLNNLMFYTLTTLTSMLLCSYRIWSPFIMHFLYFTLPSLFCSFFNPKCLFVVGNIIVVILVGESKLASSSSSSGSISSSSPVIEVHDEYAEEYAEERSTQSVTKSAILENKEEGRSLEMSMTEEHTEKDRVGKEVNEDQGHEEEEEEEQEQDGEDDDEGDKTEEEVGLPVEELNKRVEDFIARVNRQMWLESNYVLA